MSLLKCNGTAIGMSFINAVNKILTIHNQIKDGKQCS